METFIYRGTNDPQTYLEFEIAPNNVTFQAFIYNPSKVSFMIPCYRIFSLTSAKVRAAGAPFDTFFVATPLVDGLTAVTTVDTPKRLWVSSARIPLGFFNVDDGQAKGTQWRMNFFRIITAPSTFPDQWYGAWSPTPGSPGAVRIFQHLFSLIADDFRFQNFHQTPEFGHVTFV